MSTITEKNTNNSCIIEYTTRQIQEDKDVIITHKKRVFEGDDTMVDFHENPDMKITGISCNDVMRMEIITYTASGQKFRALYYAIDGEHVSPLNEDTTPDLPLMFIDAESYCTIAISFDTHNMTLYDNRGKPCMVVKFSDTGMFRGEIPLDADHYILNISSNSIYLQSGYKSKLAIACVDNEAAEYNRDPVVMIQFLELPLETAGVRTIGPIYLERICGHKSQLELKLINSNMDSFEDLMMRFELDKYTNEQEQEEENITTNNSTELVPSSSSSVQNEEIVEPSVCPFENQSSKLNLKRPTKRPLDDISAQCDDDDYFVFGSTAEPKQRRLQESDICKMYKYTTNKRPPLAPQEVLDFMKETNESVKLEKFRLMNLIKWSDDMLKLYVTLYNNGKKHYISTNSTREDLMKMVQSAMRTTIDMEKLKQTKTSAKSGVFEDVDNWTMVKLRNYLKVNEPTFVGRTTKPREELVKWVKYMMNNARRAVITQQHHERECQSNMIERPIPIGTILDSTKSRRGLLQSRMMTTGDPRINLLPKRMDEIESTCRICHRPKEPWSHVTYFYCGHSAVCKLCDGELSTDKQCIVCKKFVPLTLRFVEK
ncbi:hypothetical protein [Trichoplusia ni ascovirus 2c]|uniref:hypothetical protein n=1 Tax=Trichoplusia ni ascovirus 2c TaxID=328615 RepID=UPI0000E441DE|nr:hypothetical protein TNAV2c_gp006 [Trichoplusia ni ascovirus 2c]ABF70523.1 hypothetical protein [Trichoplusia ni ascovirus 2c]